MARLSLLQCSEHHFVFAYPMLLIAVAMMEAMVPVGSEPTPRGAEHFTIEHAAVARLVAAASVQAQKDPVPFETKRLRKEP